MALSRHGTYVYNNFKGTCSYDDYVAVKFYMSYVD